MSPSNFVVIGDNKETRELETFLETHQNVEYGFEDDTYVHDGTPVFYVVDVVAHAAYNIII